MINNQGGVAGRKTRFVINDDGFNPAKTPEHARRMPENDRVLFLFGNLGAATNSAIVKYVNAQKTPHLFPGVVGHRWGEDHKHPWTMGIASFANACVTPPASSPCPPQYPRRHQPRPAI